MDPVGSAPDGTEVPSVCPESSGQPRGAQPHPLPQTGTEVPSVCPQSSGHPQGAGSGPRCRSSSAGTGNLKLCSFQGRSSSAGAGAALPCRGRRALLPRAHPAVPRNPQTARLHGPECANEGGLIRAANGLLWPALWLLWSHFCNPSPCFAAAAGNR